MRAVLVLIAALTMVASSAVASDYSGDARRGAIDAALSKLVADADGARAMRTKIRDTARSKCRGSARSLVIRCYTEVARAACTSGDRGCLALADVIVTNQLGDASFVSDRERYSLMSEGDSFRAALDAELRRRYARIAADYTLARPGAAVDGTSIDAFCVQRAKRARLPWQRCVSALVWFIGTERAAGGSR